MRLTASQLRQIIREELSKNAEGQSLDEGMPTPAHKDQARAMVAGTSLQNMAGIVNDIAKAIADGKWKGSNAEIKQMLDQGYWAGGIVKNLTR